MVRTRNILKPVAVRVDFGSDFKDVQLLEFLRIPCNHIADKLITWTVTTPKALFNNGFYGLEGRSHLRIDGLGQVARTFDG